jgi:lipid A 3-O-deacylase
MHTSLRPLFLLAAIAAPAHAQSLADQRRAAGDTWRQGRLTHAVEIDNDSLLLRRDDGLYTSGARYTALSELGGRSVGWRIGQELYTASDINLAPRQIPAGDHPYAGWLYAGVRTAQENAGGARLATGLDLGCFGPCAGGRWTQTNLHRLLNQPLPQGWETQLKNEAGVLAWADWSPARLAFSPGVDLTPTLGLRVGNIHTDASAGLQLRVGQLGRAPGSVHGFLRVQARAVAWDATLQGGYFSGGQARAVRPERLTGELELGVRWQGEQLGLGAAIVRRANEVRSLPASLGAQNFARLQVGWTPR